jgi:hypothetical protein
MVVSIESTVFCNVALCTSTGRYQSFGETYYLQFQGRGSESGANKFLLNIRTYLGGTQ